MLAHLLARQKHYSSWYITRYWNIGENLSDRSFFRNAITFLFNILFSLLLASALVYNKEMDEILMTGREVVGRDPTLPVSSHRTVNLLEFRSGAYQHVSPTYIWFTNNGPGYKNDDSSKSPGYTRDTENRKRRPLDAASKMQ